MTFPNPKTEQVVICLSGGLDSTSLLLRLLAYPCEVFAISFDYGQKHRYELERLSRNLDYLESQGIKLAWNLIDVSSIGRILHSALIDSDWSVPSGHYEQDQMKQTVVPNRNAIFSSIAFAYALSIANRRDCQVDIALGVHAGDHTIYPDCRPEFYRAIHQAFQIGNWDSDRIGLYLPYLKADKLAILQDAQVAIATLGLDFQTVFENTLTSYAPDAEGVSEGLTGSDVERILAFDQLGVADPIDYHLPWDKIVQQARDLEREFKAQPKTAL